MLKKEPTDDTPILFLDFDGPLTNARCHFTYDRDKGAWTTPDPVVIEFLNALYKRYRYQVVLCTTWRCTLFAPAEPISHLKEHGFIGEFHKNVNTPYKVSAEKHHEISLWIQENPNATGPYAILEDEWMTDDVNWVKADPINGLIDVEEFLKLELFIAGKAGNTLADFRRFGNDP